MVYSKEKNELKVGISSRGCRTQHSVH